MTDEQQAEALLINKLDIVVGGTYWFLDTDGCRQVVVDDIEHVSFTDQNRKLVEFDKIHFHWLAGKTRWLKRDIWRKETLHANTFGRCLRARYTKPKPKLISIDVPRFGEVD